MDRWENGFRFTLQRTTSDLTLLLTNVTNLICLHWSGLHVKIPNFDRQVVPGHHVAPAVAELYIRDGGDDFRKEGTIVWIFWLFKHLKIERNKQTNKQMHVSRND